MLRATKAGESRRTACHHRSYIFLLSSSPSKFLSVQVLSLAPSLATFTRASQLPTRTFPSPSPSLSPFLHAYVCVRERERESPRAAEKAQMPVIRHDLEYASRRETKRASREFERADARHRVHRAILKSA